MCFRLLSVGKVVIVMTRVVIVMTNVGVIIGSRRFRDCVIIGRRNGSRRFSICFFVRFDEYEYVLVERFVWCEAPV